MREYTTKKKTIILALSLAVVILAGGLLILVGSMGNNSTWNKEMTDVVAENGEDDVHTEDIIPDSTVNEKTIQKQQTQEKPDQQDTLQEDTDMPEETDAIVIIPVSTEVTGEQSKPSDGKPKTPEEAIPPVIESVPVEEHINTGTESLDVVPESAPAKQETNTPQSGDTNSNGAVYVPGFGWVESNGEENSQGTAPNAGTGEIIGNM